MTFILVFIFVAIGIIFLVLEKFKWLILTTLFIFTVYLISKAKKEKNLFKNVENVTFIELCLPIIEQIDGYKKIILKDNYIILLSEYGIFIIFTINEIGTISYDANNNLVLTYGKNKLYLPNLFIDQDNIVSKYELLIKNKIKKYIITSNNCDILIKNINVSKYKLFLNEFKRKYRNKVMNKEQVDEIYQIIKSYCQLMSKCLI